MPPKKKQPSKQPSKQPPKQPPKQPTEQQLRAMRSAEAKERRAVTTTAQGGRSSKPGSRRTQSPSSPPPIKRYDLRKTYVPFIPPPGEALTYIPSRTVKFIDALETAAGRDPGDYTAG